MYRRPKGAPFVPPPEISRLPLSLLRSSLVTRQPAQTAAGIEDYQRRMAEDDDEYESPTLLPQRALFQQWKSDMLTDGPNRPEHEDWLRSAHLIEEGMHASGVPGSTVHRVKPPPVTYEEAFAARRYGGQFPEPPEDLEPPEVLSRDLPAHGRPLEPPPDAFVTAMQVSGQRAEAKRNGSCQRALWEAAAVRQRARMIVRGGQ
jgi:hypothetical protein